MQDEKQTPLSIWGALFVFFGLCVVTYGWFMAVDVSTDATSSLTSLNLPDRVVNLELMNRRELVIAGGYALTGIGLIYLMAQRMMTELHRLFAARPQLYPVQPVEQQTGP